MNCIQHNNDLFVLNTKSTSYAFRIMEETGALEHLYYGRKIHIASSQGLKEHHAFAPGNTICYQPGLDSFSMEDACLEFGSLGKGDIREPLVEVINTDGSYSLDFKYAGHHVDQGICAPATLPGSYDSSHQACQLHLDLKDEANKLKLVLIYTVFPECDVITRRSLLVNEGDGQIRVKRLLSNSIDFDRAGYRFTTFGGAWAREMKRSDVTVNSGKHVNASYTGTSSNRSNPFVMISDSATDENHGSCYGFNLIYSGNHYEALEVSAFGKSRFVQGINPQNFEFLLGPGEDFESPEAVMTFATEGFNSLSKNMHAFVREHIVRGNYKKKVRPVLLNSWEAAYFKINRSKLLKLAKAGKEVGVELFVMDDGWFAQRDDDLHSLGDWTVNEKKLPGGIASLASAINAMGLEFGIWVEPEMVNVQSQLYAEHPDWTIDIPGKAHSEGRNQRLLDLTRSEVQDWLVESMTQVFQSGNIAYVKWDMNRIFSDYYSKALPADRQQEVGHRYVMGLYRCLQILMSRFPNILFEGCASGGNRFDLGMLCYFPQIWASDNTDAICRAEIQNNYSYGYPQSVFTAHVSGVPNHQTLRRTPLETRYDVASFGLLGYECNLCDMSPEEKKKIADQIQDYKDHRELLQFGQLYRGRSFAGGNTAGGIAGGGIADGSVLSGDAGNLTEWTIAAPDGSQAIGILVQKLVQPNTQYHCFTAAGLQEDLLYHVYNKEQKINIKEYGDLINTAAPVHIKQDSLMHNLASQFVKLDGAKVDCQIYGDALMYAGLKLNQAFSGTGLNGEVRHFPDFASVRIYMDGVSELEQARVSEPE